MPIAYFILTLISFFFSRLHLPFANIILLLGLAVLTVDLLIQITRFSAKKVPLSTLLASVALLFLGIGYTFTWLFWPGARVASIFGLVIAAGFVGYWLKINAKPTARFIVTLLLMMTVGIFTTMKTSAMFLLKNDIDPDNPVAPVFIKHKLAWFYNTEANYNASMRMLLIEKKYLEKRLAEAEVKYYPRSYMEAFEKDLKIVNKAIVELSTRSWTSYEPLVREDFVD